MSEKVFVPVTDEMLYDHPERITAPLRPFRVSLPCFHWMVLRADDFAGDFDEHEKINRREKIAAVKLRG